MQKVGKIEIFVEFLYITIANLTNKLPQLSMRGYILTNRPE